MVIRPARADDLESLRDIERAAGEQFRGIGMDLVADEDPPTVAELATFQASGQAWVVADEGDHPVAYLLVHEVGGWLNIDQVSVHPDRARQGIGARLIDLAGRLALQRGLAGLTLTTYVHVPWNGPYYERLGFRILADGEIPAGLVAIRAEETRRGLDAWPRVVMARPSQN